MKIELREVTKKDWDFILNLRNLFLETFQLSPLKNIT
jgi:hypothetical protein